MQLLRLGLIGAGNVVENYHLPALSAMPNVDVAWVHDKDVQRARRLAATYRIPQVCDSLEHGPEVDAVLVAVPVGARRDVLEPVLARGWHALCEKPFAPSVTEHHWLVEEARKRQCRLGIGLLRRHYNTTKTAQALLDAHALGPIDLVLAGEGLWLHRTGRGMDWYQGNTHASGGGSLFETGSHLVDQVFTVCRVKGFRLAQCKQKQWQGLEFETSARGEVELDNGRQVPFAIVVTRMDDVYNGIVVRCRHGEVGIDLAPHGFVSLYSRESSLLGRLGPVTAALPAVYAAVRAEWQSFIKGCAGSVAFSDWDTGLLTTVFIEECFQYASASFTDLASEAVR